MMTDDDKQLWEKYWEEKSPEYRNLIAAKYLNLVRFVVEKVYYSSSMSTKDDLFNIGVIGLLDAIDKYDVSRNTKFVTYAYFRIYGNIMDHIRNIDWAPRSVKGKVGRIEKAYKALTELGNYNPTDEQLAAELRVSLKAYYKLVDGLHVNKVYSIEEFFNLGDGAEDSGDIFVNGEVQREAREQIAGIIDRGLNEKEKHILSLYYYEDCTLKEIAQVMNLTEARISQLHAAAIAKIKAQLNVEKSMNIY
jgi:RNA polymerase sigma factor for flagellar operon FliA